MEEKKQARYIGENGKWGTVNQGTTIVLPGTRAISAKSLLILALMMLEYEVLEKDLKSRSK